MLKNLKLAALATFTAASIFLALSPAARATINLFSSTVGDVIFPFVAPSNCTSGTCSTPGTIDNMTIGGTTAAAGTFTSVTATSVSASSITNSSLTPVTQGTPNAQTVSATLTAANLSTGIITVAQGASGASALQLPTASAMDTAFPAAVANSAIIFSVINTSTVSAEAASLTTNTGWTLVGDMDIIANSASTTKSAGRFLARKTGTAAWVLYRIS